jgi:hypothetical protein
LLIHSDIVGPLPMSFPDKYRYVGTFLDDYSRYVVVALMQRKSDIGVAFASFRRFLQQSVGTCDAAIKDVEVDSSNLPNISDAEVFRIVRLHSDNAKEYQHIENDDANKDITNHMQLHTPRSTTPFPNVSTGPSWTPRDRC